MHSVKTLDGEPFDLSRSARYNISAFEFLAYGRDGFTAFTDPEVEWLVDAESAISIQDIIFGALESFGPNYEPVEKLEARRQRRLALLNTSDDDRSEHGFIKLRP